MNLPSLREEELLRQLAEAREELDSFTYSVSHDLKSPLHTIMGFVDLVLEDLAAGRTQTLEEDLNRVREASHALQGQLEAVLEFSRIGRGAHVLVELPVGDIWDNLRRRWDPAFDRVGGRLELGGSATTVCADAVKFYALLDHLLDNALSFRSGDRPLLVQVRLDEEGGQLKGLVRDNGRGVPSEQLQRIFELFRKVEQDSPGRGIGLTLARKILVLHGGHIAAKSEGVGKGTSIEFVMPRAHRDLMNEAHGQA